MNLKINKNNLVLNGDQMSGNTFQEKDFIKSKLDGKWNSASKTWTVNTDKVNYWIEKGALIVCKSETQPSHAYGKRTGTAESNGWCDLCHSYCWGDCQA